MAVKRSRSGSFENREFKRLEFKENVSDGNDRLYAYCHDARCFFEFVLKLSFQLIIYGFLGNFTYEERY